MSKSLPVQLADIQGLWHRLYLKTADRLDRETWVRWIQSDQFHVDVRLVTEQFDAASSCSLSDLTADQLLIQAGNEGFAGVTSVEDSLCTWRRQINFQGPVVERDVGKLQWLQDEGGIPNTSMLLESGVLADYEELWQRNECENTQAASLVSESGQRVILIWSRTLFAMARDKESDMDEDAPLSLRLANALIAGETQRIASLFDREYCFGKISDGAAEIQHSTQAFRSGDVIGLLPPDVSSEHSIELISRDFYGQELASIFRLQQDQK